MELPNKRPDDMARITTIELANKFIEEQVALVREQVKDKKVLLALSGGVDSSVVAALLIKAIGKQLVCVHVNHGLMRKGESEEVVEVFGKQLDANLIYIDATDRFLDLLKDVAEPEKKRKIIGGEFIKVRLYRPFPAVPLANALANVKAVAIMDRAEGYSNHGGPLGADVMSALYRARSQALAVNYIYGLGGRDVRVESIEEVFAALAEVVENNDPGDPYRYLGIRE